MENLSFENLPRAVELLIDKVEALTEMLQAQSNNPQKEDNADRYLSIKELMEYLPNHPAKQTVYNWIHRRRIPHVKQEGNLLFRKSEIDQWLNQGRRKTENEIRENAIDYLK